MEKEIKQSNTTKDERKEKALEIMEQLEIYKPYIKGFENNDEVGAKITVEISCS